MGTKPKQQVPRRFGGKGGKLALALAEQSIGIRTLARRLEAREGLDRSPEQRKSRVEAIRRSLNLYVHHGRVATELVRQAIEDELGMERDALKSDEDDEEDQAVRVTFPITIDLPQELVDRAVQKHLEAKASEADALRGLETA